MLKLNLGCGDNRLPGWKNHDADVDITRPLPWASDTVDYIFIEHCVEHVTYHQAIAFFKEAYRVLKPNGKLRVTVPSIEKISGCSNQSYFDWLKQRGWAPTADVRGAMHAIIHCHGHQMAWTDDLMRHTLKFAGFAHTEQAEPGESTDPALRSVEGHHKVIGKAYNDIESICFDALKPPDVKTVNLDVNYDEKFYTMHVPWRNEYENIALWLENNMEFNSAVDFGCGNGYILSRLARNGKAIMGVDGSSNVLKHFPDAIIRDLTQPLIVGKHDLAICVEVAEHIDEKYADTLVDTVCNASSNWVLFSAAKAGHGGHHHVNEQEREYWYKKFEARGFTIDLPMSNALCDYLRGTNKKTWWFANNSFIAWRDPKVHRVAIVVGGAHCWEQDVINATKLCSAHDIQYIVVNDQIASFPNDNVIGCTLHVDKLNKWLGERKNNGYVDPVSLYTHTGARSLGSHINQVKDWGGSSGLFGYLVARSLGYEKIVFCGVPMTSEPNFFRGQKWHAVTAFTRSWQQHRDEIKKYARSMSGWSAELIGKPDEDFFR